MAFKQTATEREHFMRHIPKENSNVALVRFERYRIVRNSLPKEVNNELMDGVKRGELCIIKKGEYKNFQKRVFYHPDFRHLAIEAINEELEVAKKARMGIFC